MTARQRGDDGPDDDRRIPEGLDPASLAVGALVGLAGLLFLAQPLGPWQVAGSPVEPMVLSAPVLAAGFGLGAAVYGRRGRGRIALAHGVAACGFALVAVAAGLSSPPVLFAGFVILIGGAVAITLGARR